MPRYKHAEILRAVADAAESSETPWEVVEYKYADVWVTPGDVQTFCRNFSSGAIFRIKPKTRIINGVECPEALRGAPDVGTRVWTERPDIESYSEWEIWGDEDHQVLALTRGIVHLTEEAAVACCKARLGEGE